MKKQITAIVVTFVTLLTLISKPSDAAISGNLLPAITDSISWDHVRLQTNVNGFSGNFAHYFLWRIVGDTFQVTTIVSTGMSPFKRVLSGLPPSTTIQVYSVIEDSGVIDTTNSISFMTKPLPHAAYITVLTPVSSPAQTIQGFTYDLSVPTRVYLNYNGYQNFSDTVIVGPGTGSSNVAITNPNVPGTTYYNNLLFAEPIETGIVSDTFVPAPDFTVPSTLMPDISGVTFSNVTQDSFQFSVHVTIGNALTATVVARDLDSAGVVTTTRTPVVTTSDTTITWTRTGLPDENLGEQVVVMTVFGSDSITAYQRLSQVNAPQVVSADTVSATVSSTSLTIRVKTNGSASWANSDAVVTVRYVNQSGTTVTLPTQAVQGSSAVATLTFTGLINLKQNPQTNSAVVYIQNGASLVDSLEITFVVAPPHPAVPISTGWYIQAESAFQMSIHHVDAGTTDLTNTFKLKVLVNVVGSGHLDTFLLRPNQSGFTNFLQVDTVGGLTGNTNYEFRLATENVDGIWFVTSTSQEQPTIPAANPSGFVSNSGTVTTTSVDFNTMGCGNGTPTYLEAKLSLFTIPLTFVSSQSLGYQGTGNFSVSGSFSGLDDCTEYIIEVFAHDGSMGNQIPIGSRRFTTICETTGIANANKTSLKLFPNPAVDQVTISGEQSLGEVTIYSLIGEKVFSQNISDKSATIQVTNFAPGIYVVTGTGFTKQFTKQ